MKVRISIYAKIAGLFLANVIALALLLGWIVRQQWGISALPTFRSDKLETVGEGLFRELEKLPMSEWDGLLATASREHGVTFYLYSIDGPRLAGPADFLPGNVHSEITGGIGDRRRPPPLGDDFGGRQPPRPPEPPRRQTDEKHENRVNPRPILSAADGYWSLTPGTLEQLQGPWKVALVTRSESPTGNGFYTNTLGIVWLCAAMLVISLLVWLPFIHSAMRSLRKMQSTAGKLAAGDFTARANAHRNDELGALGHSVNHMADQIGSLVDGQKRLLGDIAHELSSPIARMQAVLGILESPGGGYDNREKYMAKLDGELQQMGALVQELLSLSKASLRRSIELRPIPLLQQIERIVEREKQNGEVVVVEVHEEIVVLGEPELLSRAVGNVLRNAIRYAGKAGPITIQATRANDETVIAISDQGPGVPEASLPRIFDAFYRPDIARTRETGGNGLGLAIVKTCLEAMHGSVTARNRSGGGLIVEMTLLSE